MGGGGAECYLCGGGGGGIHITKEDRDTPLPLTRIILSPALFRAPRCASIPLAGNCGAARAPGGAPPLLPGQRRPAARRLGPLFPGEAERTGLGLQVPGRSPGRGWRGTVKAAVQGAKSLHSGSIEGPILAGREREEVSGTGVESPSGGEGCRKVGGKCTLKRLHLAVRPSSVAEKARRSWGRHSSLSLSWHLRHEWEGERNPGTAGGWAWMREGQLIGSLGILLLGHNCEVFLFFHLLKFSQQLNSHSAPGTHPGLGLGDTQGIRTVISRNPIFAPGPSTPIPSHTHPSCWESHHSLGSQDSVTWVRASRPRVVLRSTPSLGSYRTSGHMQPY